MEVIAAQREYLEELEEKASECKNKENNKKEG